MVGGMGFCRRNVWVDFSCRSQLRRGLVPYINTELWTCQSLTVGWLPFYACGEAPA